MKKKIMKEKNWRYITIALSIITIVLFAYSVLAPVSLESEPGLNENLVYSKIKNNVPDDVMVDVDNLVSIKPSVLDPDDLDQNWETHTHAAVVGYSWYLQGFKNLREPMLGFDMKISRHGMPTTDLIVGLLDSRLDGSELLDPSNWLYGAVISPSIFEDLTWYWFPIEFAVPLQVNAEQTYYIVCMSAVNGDNYWRWALQYPNGGYDRGIFYTYDIDDEKWHVSAQDACFGTYTETGGDEPIIDITVTSSISMQLGFIAFIGAVLSGTKYYFSFIR